MEVEDPGLVVDEVILLEDEDDELSGDEDEEELPSVEVELIGVLVVELDVWLDDVDDVVADDVVEDVASNTVVVVEIPVDDDEDDDELEVANELELDEVLEVPPVETGAEEVDEDDPDSVVVEEVMVLVEELDVGELDVGFSRFTLLLCPTEIFHLWIHQLLGCIPLIPRFLIRTICTHF